MNKGLRIGLTALVRGFEGWKNRGFFAGTQERKLLRAQSQSPSPMLPGALLRSTTGQDLEELPNVVVSAVNHSKKSAAMRSALANCI